MITENHREREKEYPEEDKMKAFLFRLAIRIKDFGEQKRKPWLIRLGLKLKWRVMQ